MITGTGLQPGIQVTFGSATVSARFDPRYRDRIFLTTPGHAAGLVDVVVTNPDRQTGLASGAYTFASPDSFDVNGDWKGGAFGGHELFAFTVVSGSVVSVSCWTSGSVTLSPPAPIRNGEISFSGDDGVAISGKILSPTEAKGRATVGPCVGADWYASKEWPPPPAPFNFLPSVPASETGRNRHDEKNTNCVRSSGGFCGLYGCNSATSRPTAPGVPNPAIPTPPVARAS